MIKKLLRLAHPGLRRLSGEHLFCDRRQLICAAAMCGASGSILTASANEDSTMQAESPESKAVSLRPAGAPSADSGYSPAIFIPRSGLLFISGQGPQDLRADMETQIRQTFDRIGILLEAAGGTFSDLVLIRSFWVHLLRDIEIYRKVRKDYLVEPYPASTAVGTPELAIPGLELEIEAVAVVNPDNKR